jgi:alkylation response protein AidB-like acyl-CoA dehydrogenase
MNPSTMKNSMPSAKACAPCAPNSMRVLAQDRREKASRSLRQGADRRRLAVGDDPEEYGGSGLGLAEASVIMEEVNRCGGNSGACHGQMYNMFTLLRHGSEAQKRYYLPKLASGELRLQSMGVTEPTTGTDTTKIKTTASSAATST